MEMIRKKEAEEHRLFQDFNEMIHYNMKEMQQCLLTAGKLFCSYDKEIPAGRSGREVVESVILKECVGCREREGCRFTMEDKDRLGQIMEEQGGLSLADVRSFHPCKRERDFVEEANRIYERELFFRAMERGMIQMRRMVGHQYIEAGQMLGEFSDGKFGVSSLENQELYQKILKGFSQVHLKIKEIYFYENQEKGKQIYLFLKKKKRREISVRQVSILLSELIKRKMNPLPGQRKMIGSHYEMIGFTPAAKFHVLGGIRSVAYADGEKNGDSFSMGKIGERRFVSMISDGMGTGNEANIESKRTVEMLEELLEAGIAEDQAIGLLQSIFVPRPQKEQYATLDYFQLDLFAGVGTFLKIGACPGFLKRKNQVEILRMEGVPVGVVKEMPLPFCRKKFESEDLLIQVSDGVIDSIPGNGIEIIRDYMEEIRAIRPQAFADELFHKIEDTEGYEKKDDMTILVLGIWDKY